MGVSASSPSLWACVIGTLLFTLSALGATTDVGTLGPWRVGDMACSTTLADDRPNAEVYAATGLNLQRTISFEEMIKNPPRADSTRRCNVQSRAIPSDWR